jgi:membrane protein implicated in regulation of membrane protease activity
MRRPAAALVIVVLVGIAAYSVFVAIHAVVTAEDYDPPVFWVAIGIFFLLAATALWAARRIYRTRFSRPSE